MAIQIQLRQGTTTEHSKFTGAVGEVTVDTTKKTLVLHDGVTAGGKPLPTLENGKVPLDQLPDSTTSTKGIVQLATQTEVDSGTDAVRAVTPATLKSTLKSTFPIQAKTALNASGDAPMYACRAWVNFDGTTGAIRASGNVSSVTSEGRGTYLITFTQGMSDANYVVNSVGSARGDGTALAPVDGSFTTSSFRVRANYGGDNTPGAYNPQICCVTVFR